MSPRYGHRILVSGLAKTRLRHTSLPFDSLPYPTRTICRRVRTLGQSRDNQTKRGWPYSMSMGLCPTRASRAGDPLLTPKTPSKSPKLRPKPKISVNFITFKTQRMERCYDPLFNSKTRKGFLISALASLQHASQSFQ